MNKYLTFYLVAFCLVQGYAQSKTNGTILFHADFTKGIPADFVNMGGWMQCPGGITSTAEGLNNYLLLNRQYAVNTRKASIKVSLGSDTKLNFFSPEIDHYHHWGTLIQVDVKAGVLKIFKAYNVDEKNMPDVLQEHPYKFIAGRDYDIEMLNEPTRNCFIVIDNATGKSDTAIVSPRLPSGLVRDVFAFATESGSPPVVKSMTVSTQYKKGLNILFFGDSITEGFLRSPTSFSQNGKSVISGRSAGIVLGVQNRVYTELAILRPKYVSILIGTNGFNTVENLTQLCKSILKLGVTPILNNIPWKLGKPVTDDNRNIAQVRKALNLRGAAFDAATSVNGLNKQQDTTLFDPDTVHPNELGMQSMFRQFKKDVPGIFK